MELQVRELGKAGVGFAGFLGYRDTPGICQGTFSSCPCLCPQLNQSPKNSWRPEHSAGIGNHGITVWVGKARFPQPFPTSFAALGTPGGALTPEDGLKGGTPPKHGNFPSWNRSLSCTCRVLSPVFVSCLILNFSWIREFSEGENDAFGILCWRTGRGSVTQRLNQSQGSVISN